MRQMERIEPVGSGNKGGLSKLEPWQGTVVDPTLAALIQERRWLHQAAGKLDTTVAALDGACPDLAILLYVRHRVQMDDARLSAAAARQRLRLMGAVAEGSTQDELALFEIAKKPGGLHAVAEFRGSVSLHFSSQVARRQGGTPLAAMRKTRDLVRSCLDSLDQRITAHARVHAFNDLNEDEAAKRAKVLTVEQGARPGEVNILVSIPRPLA